VVFFFFKPFYQYLLITGLKKLMTKKDFGIHCRDSAIQYKVVEQ
jgi:hypothetical protein